MSFQGAVRLLLVGWADGVGSRWLGLMSFQGAVRSLLVGWAVLVAGWLGLMSFQGAAGSLQADGFSHMWPTRLREGGSLLQQRFTNWCDIGRHRRWRQRSRRHWVFGLTGLERLDKIECWLAQSDCGGTMATGRDAGIGPSTLSVPRRASDPIVRAAHKGIHARHAWRFHGGVDRVTGFKETAVLVWYRDDGVFDVAFRLLAAFVWLSP